MTAANVALLRLAAQRIAGGHFPTVTESARWLTAAQGQDLRGVMTSLALRTQGGTAADVEVAFNKGQIVRSWPMRGTLHVVAAEDLGWMLRVAARRVITGSAARWRGLGLDDAVFAEARTAAIGALSGGRRLTREQLYAAWQGAGIDTSGQRGIHLILQLALTGVLCYGPMDGPRQQLVLLDEWVPVARRLEKDEALGEWALRFFTSHGPASLQDFARWAKLPLGESRAGLAVARPCLERLELDGVELWMDPATPDRLAAWRARARGVFLLPGFDEFILGYADRSVVISPLYADRVVPGNNGMFQHTVVVAGQVVGTWKRTPRGSKAPLVATPFATVTPAVQKEIDRLALALP